MASTMHMLSFTARDGKRRNVGALLTGESYKTYNINIGGVVRAAVNKSTQLRELFHGKQYWSRYDSLQKQS